MLTHVAARRPLWQARWLCVLLFLNPLWTQKTFGQDNQNEIGGLKAAALSLPTPSGPFEIGRIGYQWSDPARPDAHAAGPDAHRDLMVYLWYPAPRTDTGKRAPYIPGAKQMDANPEVQRRATEDFGPGWGLIVSGELGSHAVENAPAAKSSKPFPVVLFSHGLGSLGFAYTALIEDLVSHGYVVASIEHTYTAMAVVFPDGRLVPFHEEAGPMQVSAGRTITEGARDVVFVLSKLIEMNGQKAHKFALGRRLDMSRVAAMGHSSGGAFATLACQMDDRFTACISLDGALPPVAAFPEYGKGFTQPVLLLEVDHSGQRRGFDAAQEAEYLKKKKAQLDACPTGSFDIVLKSPGLFHASFSDVPLLFANGKTKETGEALYNLRATQAFTRSFLDKYLKHDAGKLLNDPSEYRGTIVTSYGH